MRHETWVADTRESCDTVASAYAELTRDAFETDALEIERALLDVFVSRVQSAGGGPVLDAGCGPGWLTGHLSRRGLDMVGLDLSPGLLAVARAHHRDVPFALGSITELPYADGSMAGLVCWYVVHHVPDDVLPAAFAEFGRVLALDGQLLVAGHIGEGSRIKTEGYGGPR